MSERFSSEINSFIDSTEWTWAKTYADTWPHHYIVKERVDEDFFLKIVMHIRQHGKWEYFYNTQLKYYEQDGIVYWTMVPKDNDSEWYPPEDEDIINKCPSGSTYASRLKDGTLPS